MKSLFSLIIGTVLCTLGVIKTIQDNAISSVSFIVGIGNLIIFFDDNKELFGIKKVKECTYQEHRTASKLFGIKPLNPIKFILWKYGIIKSYSEKIRIKEESESETNEMGK